MKTFSFLFLLSTFLLTGCAAKNDLSTFYAHRPRSIVVVPVVNESPQVTASSVFLTTITRPLAERGYYVFPVYLTDMVLRDFGLTEAGHIHQLPPSKFNEVFGADAVLFITIKDWSTKYMVLVSTVTVEMEYVLKDTKTGQILWQHTQPYVYTSNGGGNPIVALVSAAMTALLVDYLPLAKEANIEAFKEPFGLPAGQYHPDFEKDNDRF
jgi:hypothetical protein